MSAFNKHECAHKKRKKKKIEENKNKTPISDEQSRLLQYCFIYPWEFTLRWEKADIFYDILNVWLGGLWLCSNAVL